jgi:hypothetical protein
MAKRESIWKANDGTEHRSKQSAAVADAEHAVFEAVADAYVHEVGGVETAANIVHRAEQFADLLSTLIKARAALAKHEAKGEK